MLKVESVETGYSGKRVLKDVSFTVNDGEVAGIVGANGSGKSTMLKSICGSLEIWKGAIEFQDSGVTNIRCDSDEYCSCGEDSAHGQPQFAEGLGVFPNPSIGSCDITCLNKGSAASVVRGIISWAMRELAPLDSRDII